MINLRPFLLVIVGGLFATSTLAQSIGGAESIQLSTGEIIDDFFNNEDAIDSTAAALPSDDTIEPTAILLYVENQYQGKLRELASDQTGTRRTSQELETQRPDRFMVPYIINALRRMTLISGEDRKQLFTDVVDVTAREELMDYMEELRKAKVPLAENLSEPMAFNDRILSATKFLRININRFDGLLEYQFTVLPLETAQLQILKKKGTRNTKAVYEMIEGLQLTLDPNKIEQSSIFVDPASPTLKADLVRGLKQVFPVANEMPRVHYAFSGRRFEGGSLSITGGIEVVVNLEAEDPDSDADDLTFFWREEGGILHQDSKGEIPLILELGEVTEVEAWVSDGHADSPHELLKVTGVRPPKIDLKYTWRSPRNIYSMRTLLRGKVIYCAPNIVAAVDSMPNTTEADWYIDDARSVARTPMLAPNLTGNSQGIKIDSTGIRVTPATLTREASSQHVSYISWDLTDETLLEADHFRIEVYAKQRGFESSKETFKVNRHHSGPIALTMSGGVMASSEILGGKRYRRSGPIISTGVDLAIRTGLDIEAVALVRLLNPELPEDVEEVLGSRAAYYLGFRADPLTVIGSDVRYRSIGPEFHIGLSLFANDQEQEREWTQFLSIGGGVYLDATPRTRYSLRGTYQSNVSDPEYTGDFFTLSLGMRQRF